jgi:hypothetical protein
MKKIFLYSILFLLYSCGSSSTKTPTEFTSLETISQWQKDHSSNKQIYQEGKIIKLLQDENEGSKHQKFIIKLKNDITLLVSHNIDIATRIPDLEQGETIVFYGEYEWNKKGGVVHWTHKDPRGNHADGYLLYGGKKYD